MSLRRKLVLVISAIILPLVALEFFVRFILGVQPEPQRMQLSPLLGWEWTPGYAQEERYYGETYRMEISEQGLRNEIVEIPRPANVFRIISLGDSVTEGPGVDLGETFSKRLQDELQASMNNPGIEVINAGTGDYGLEQEMIWYENRGLYLEPDLVVLNLYLNDSRSFDPPPAAVAYLNNFLLPRSSAYFFYSQWLQTRMADREIQENDFRFRFSSELDSQLWRTEESSLTTLIQAADEDWGLAWIPGAQNRLAELLLAFHQELMESGIDLLVVIFPVSVQVYTGVDTPLDIEAPQKFLTKILETQGIAYLDLLPVLKNRSDGLLYFDQAHFRASGHQIVSEAILGRLLETGWLEH